ncbi:hypothetical protein [Hugenholtzia roseola]|uniref:hypothetical protein n=1 Tax=Hugenholtzia roseola TaxID=1002 RepID=UPI0003FD71F3|nr:hypothetical protein [Hugenholtzia roseola]
MPKKIAFFFLLFANLLIFKVQGEDKIMEAFKKADVLYESEKYIDAFQVYSVLWQDLGVFNEGMLLKMASIKERSKEHEQALYYLSLYYRYFPDKKVLEKMSELAAAKDLQGYQYSDLKYFQMLWLRYELYGIGIGSFLALVFIVLIIKRMKEGSSPWSLVLTNVLILVGLGVAYHFSRPDAEFIVTHNHVALMQDPSAAAELVEWIDKGHKLPLLGKQDIWIQTEWKGQTVFIREHNAIFLN